METITLSSLDENEEYMSENHLHWFKTRLHLWREELITGAREVRDGLKQSGWSEADMFDVEAKNRQFSSDIGTMARNREKLQMIDMALLRIESGEYGYCELTGKEIGLKRLMAQPTAMLCIDVQEMLERSEGRTAARGALHCFA